MPHSLKESMLNNQIPLHIQRNVTKDWSMSQFHFHDSYEINLSISGGNHFFINNQVHDVKSRDIFLFNADDIHKTILPNDFTYERVLVFFNPDFVRAWSTNTTPLLSLFENRDASFQHKRSLSMKDYERIMFLFEQMLLFQDKPDFGCDVRFRLSFIELLLELHAIYSQEHLHLPITSANYIKIKPILDYIDTHLEQTISLDELESLFYINKYYLCELFKKTTGLTINTYHNSRRLLRAKELLQQGLTVSETASRVGYNSDSHFIKTFKKFVGTTPKNYI